MFKDFNIEKVKGRKKGIVLSVRISQEDFDWLKNHHVSATKLFNYALHKIRKQENGKTKTRTTTKTK